jgi:hypothetical protein
MVFTSGSSLAMRFIRAKGNTNSLEAEDEDEEDEDEEEL